MVPELIPRRASTVLTLRDGVEGFEVLMLRRNLNSDFVGGAYVFPGGGVDDDDDVPSLGGQVLGLDDVAASTRLALQSGGLSYFVAGLRELFEEAGLLVVRDDHGGTVAFTDPALVRRLADQRRAINAGNLPFFEMLTNEGLMLDVREMAYLAHWVTPVGPPRRFDTRFFVIVAPPHQIALHDDGETIDSRWVRPREALAAHERGELEMILPTIRNLENIAAFTSAHEVVAYANSLVIIPCIEPRIVVRDGRAVILLPGDEGFDDY